MSRSVLFCSVVIATLLFAGMAPVAAAGGASVGWNGDHFEDMGTWFNAVMADTFA